MKKLIYSLLFGMRLRRFVVEVGDLVAPHAVHRLARFKRQAADLLPRKPGGVLARKVALENLDVLAFERDQVVVVTHQTGRPDGMDMVVQPAEFPHPFENKDVFEKQFPAQFISEAVDQTRGWFHSLMAESTLLFNKAPYENRQRNTA